MTALVNTGVPGERYSVVPSSAIREFVPGGSIVDPGIEADEDDTRLGQRISAVGHLHDWVDQRCGVDRCEQQIDVDVFGGEAAAHHVVARPHQFDAGTVEVAVEVAGGEMDRLAGLQRDPIEQQCCGDAGIIVAVPSDELVDQHTLRRR